MQTTTLAGKPPCVVIDFASESAKRGSNGLKNHVSPVQVRPSAQSAKSNEIAQVAPGPEPRATVQTITLDTNDSAAPVNLPAAKASSSDGGPTRGKAPSAARALRWGGDTGAVRTSAVVSSPTLLPISRLTTAQARAYLLALEAAVDSAKGLGGGSPE